MLQWVHLWTVFNFKIILKHKPFFYLTRIVILLIKHKLISFDWIFYVILLCHNNLIVPNLLINYLNLMKEPIQKQLLISILQNSHLRSSCLQMFFKIAVHNILKYSQKIPVSESHFNKIAGLKAYKETPTQVHSCKFWEIFKNTFFTEHLPWVFL